MRDLNHQRGLDKIREQGQSLREESQKLRRSEEELTVRLIESDYRLNPWLMSARDGPTSFPSVRAVIGSLGLRSLSFAVIVER